MIISIVVRSVIKQWIMVRSKGRPIPLPPPCFFSLCKEMRWTFLKMRSWISLILILICLLMTAPMWLILMRARP
ncbi:MAG: hypothetical protein J0652_07180 [Desulfobulbaceae bacterium]|nr:hypothetical protein [Desulfobulbaceae bacterium]